MSCDSWRALVTMTQSIEEHDHDPEFQTCLFDLTSKHFSMHYSRVNCLHKVEAIRQQANIEETRAEFSEQKSTQIEIMDTKGEVFFLVFFWKKAQRFSFIMFHCAKYMCVFQQTDYYYAVCVSQVLEIVINQFLFKFHRIEAPNCLCKQSMPSSSTKIKGLEEQAEA